MDIIKASDPGFSQLLRTRTERAGARDDEVETRVKEILHRVRHEGDAALREYCTLFDGNTELCVSAESIAGAHKKVSAEIQQALRRACDRIEAFHRRQVQNSWFQTEDSGVILGQIVRPLERVGIYVPGGKALYPSSVLMNAVPARVAGVPEIIMVTPGRREGIDPVILAAADLCGIQRIFQIGGAQAVAALAYGTHTVPRVDKIVGPGNIYVATAKKLVYGTVDIDMIAGPSEILILSDGSGNPAWVAADMLSQAEHDEMASAVLVGTSESFCREVAQCLVRQLAALPKSRIAGKALADNGLIVVAEHLAAAAAIANDMAPEHLELFVEKPWDLLPLIKHAGAVFLGHYTPEAIGDYIAGPNHVLPTGGTARFYSPLSVDAFIKKTSLISYTPTALGLDAEDAVRLAHTEQLDAHARSVSCRMTPDTGR